MVKPITSDRAPPAMLTLKLGHWLEAQASGWGVAALAFVVFLALGAAVLRTWLG